MSDSILFLSVFSFHQIVISVQICYNNDRNFFRKAVFSMKLTILADNTTRIDAYYLDGPAVCYYIECDGMKFLFDTGYSNV